MENNQYKGFAYTKGSDRPTVVYGTSAQDILAKLNSYNVARMENDKFMACNIGSLNAETSKYEEYHRYDVATGKDISSVYLQIPPLKKEEFQKVIADLKAAGARFNVQKKAWYISADQDQQGFQDICNQFSNNTAEIDAIRDSEEPEKPDFMIEGVEVQYAVKLQNQQTVIIPESDLNMLKLEGSINEFLDRLNEKAVGQLQQISGDLEQIDPGQIASESEYMISVDRDSHFNRCTVWFNDGREPVSLNGYVYGLDFPSMETDAVAEFVSEYLRQQNHLENALSEYQYREGNWINCYVPLRLQDSSPNQPIYVENIRHISGTVQAVQPAMEQNGSSNGVQEYTILDDLEGMQTIRSDEIYTSNQAQVLLRAAADELTGVQFDLLADKRLTAAQMEEIRFGFKDGLSVEQVALYANPEMTPAEMDLCRIGLTNGLSYKKISDLLKETKELSWTDSRNRLNGVIKARTAAHEAGLAFSEHTTPEEIEEMDPYVYDGSMSVEDHMQVLSKIEKEAEVNSAAEPTVTIIWSESDRLRDGETMPLSRANELFTELDKENIEKPYYLKTKFRIDYVMDGEPKQYEGQQDFGDGEGSLVEHIERFHEGYLNNEEWHNQILRNDGQAALEADRELRTRVLNGLIPYLKMHCNLTEMERTAGEVLKSYVSESRGLINQGDYNLPPVPQLADLELEAYKEHVREEVAQEAAVAGMTVDEYAANGYEPSAAPEQEDRQTADFYGMDVPVEDGMRVIPQEAIYDLLDQGIENPDFSNCIFRGIDFFSDPISPLSGINFANSRFYDCKFYDADVHGSNFQGALLHHTNFKNGTLRECDFGNARFRNCMISGMDVVKVNFSKAIMKQVNIENCAIEENDFYMTHMDSVKVSASCGITADQKNLDTVTYLNRGADPAEKDKVMWRLSGSEVTYERKEEMSRLFRDESNDPDTQEWREDLTYEERELVGSWEKQRSKLSDALLEILENESNNPDMQEWREDLTYEERELVESREKQRHTLSEQDDLRVHICEDITKSGYKPTETLISNIQKLDAITGERHSLKDVVNLYRQNNFQNNQELSKAVLDIAEECKQQELAKMPVPEANIPG